MGHYTKRKKSGDIYHGYDRSDAEPGFYHLPEYQRRAIIRAYRAGEMTTRDIAKEFNCTERTVRRWAEIAGIPPKQSSRNVGPVSDEALNRALKLYQTATPIPEIAALLGVVPTDSAIRGKLKTELRRRGMSDTLQRKPRSDLGQHCRRYSIEEIVGWYRKRQSGLEWKSIVRPENAKKCNALLLYYLKMRPEIFKEAA